MNTKKFSPYLLLVFFSLMFSAVCYAASPVGTWTSIDDVTGKPRSIIKVWQSNNILYGKILKVYPQPGDTGICLKCPGNFKNKKIKGLTIMWGLKQVAANEWSGGSILDPKSGRVYRCKINVASNGQTLKVRGYLGFSLLGRTQTWVKR